jgi:hypothetical protein
MLFMNSGKGKGKYHWSSTRFYNQIKLFVKEDLEITEPTRYQVYAIALLLYPTKGILKENEETGLVYPSCPELYRTLGKDGVLLYRGIFINNNITLVGRFFKDTLIQRIWPKIKSSLTYDHCFRLAPPNPEIMLTYKYIISVLKGYKIFLPAWYVEQFSG